MGSSFREEVWDARFVSAVFWDNWHGALFRAHLAFVRKTIQLDDGGPESEKKKRCRC